MQLNDTWQEIYFLAMCLWTALKLSCVEAITLVVFL